MSEEEASDKSSLMAGEPDPLLDLAYEAATNRLASQTAAFEGFRTRASGILAIAALVTSFSAGLGLVNTDPTKGPVLPWWAPWALLLILLLVGAFAFLILMPTKKWVHGPSPGVVLQVRERVETPEEGKLAMVQLLIEDRERNSEELKRRALFYRIAVLLLLVEIAVLVSAVAVGKAQHDDRPAVPKAAELRSSGHGPTWDSWRAWS
ncbi:hypothetical protein ACFY64_32080 [Streptomyces collinus]|uniref:hypothetical protein n=1 Tax=Streptomyces collinus TaxID=42684 RepID=UPI0036A2A391